jgi:TetR/AcrR family transcriptional regulator, mexJK operon transcriptional repressor
MVEHMAETVRPGKDERRATILNIAREAFLRDGYAAASMSQIAAKLGGSKATLYNYFSSKKELFFAVVDAESVKMLGHLYDADKNASDVHTALKDFCRRFVRMVLSDEIIAFNRMVVAESVRFPEVGQAMFELGFKRGIDRMKDLIQRGVDTGILRCVDARQAAEFVLTICAGHLHDLKTWNVGTTITDADIERQIEHASNAFLAFYGNDELATLARTYTGL